MNHKGITIYLFDVHNLWGTYRITSHLVTAMSKLIYNEEGEEYGNNIGGGDFGNSSDHCMYD